MPTKQQAVLAISPMALFFVLGAAADHQQHTSADPVEAMPFTATLTRTHTPAFERMHLPLILNGIAGWP